MTLLTAIHLSLIGSKTIFDEAKRFFLNEIGFRGLVTASIFISLLLLWFTQI